MRVTASTKETTRAKILEVATELFNSNGFDATTSRDLAAAAGIAAGTIFNYFSSKEAIVLQLITDALEDSEQVFLRRSKPTATLEEDLYLHISTGLRQLLPVKTYAAPAFEAFLGPDSSFEEDSQPELIRRAHLEVVSGLLEKHGMAEPPSAMQLQMYWLLYTGVLNYWVKDLSRKQEDTLALLDQSVKMFVNWIAQN